MTEAPPFPGPEVKRSDKEDLELRAAEALQQSLQTEGAESNLALKAAEALMAEAEKLQDCDACGESKDAESDFNAYTYNCDACSEFEAIYGYLPKGPHWIGGL